MSVASTPDDSAHAGHNHHHDPNLAHHFESPLQQFDAGKLGMWLFLVTEVLFFSGLFTAYAVFRSNHPEAFADADKYLNVMLGATNTAVLIFSSLTMAWAVRAAQLGQHKNLAILLTITLSCASVFLGVKAVEYSHKWDEGLMWASQFNPQHHEHHGLSWTLIGLCVPAVLALLLSTVMFAFSKVKGWAVGARFFVGLMIASAAFFLGVGLGELVPIVQTALSGESANVEAQLMADHGAVAVADGQADIAERLYAEEIEQGIDPRYTAIFFSIYYGMTGLHAIHILIGMGVIAWLLFRALSHEFGPTYFGPVDYVGLYWHLVDLIWIYLFPLLYLIG